jgi:crotonobetainyl-CoA:carnitine CoA-transferase CaiB-like acyl-CoA transferase
MRTLWGAVGANPDAPNGAFIAANRGKRSLAVDVTTDAGRAVLDRLLAGADVLVTNLRPRALERLGLAPAATADRFPRLVYCSLTAYGWGGPDEERAGYDLAAFYGRAGVAHETTTAGEPPAPLMLGIGDMFAAMAAAAGVTAALLERERTGRGRFVEASLLRTGMWALSGSLGGAALGGRPRPPAPRHECPTPMFNAYQAGDGRWFFLVGVDAARLLPKVLAAIGRKDLASDERFADARSLARHRREFIAVLDEAFAARPLEEWAATFDEHDVWWAPVQTPFDLLDDPQARAAGAWVEVDAPGPNPATVASVDSPVRYDGAARRRAPGPPAVGQHNREILAGLGYSKAEIDSLLSA